jgi:DNA polymerase-1
MKTLYLVDASNMFFRAFFAIPPLTNDKGMPTNALYGFLAMSLKLIREVKPDYLVYCFDRKEPSFRHELYTEYKAHRDEMPENLVPQVPYLKKLTEALGVAQVEQAGFEADDVIGTLVSLAQQNHVASVIVSGDKDFAQLVRPQVSLYDTMKDVRTDVDGVKAKFGIRPDQMIDYLAIVGDSSDNVPGIRGLGPKGAQKLLHDFETLDGIYQHVDQIKGATQKKLIEHKDMAFLSRKLVTIVTDMNLQTQMEDLRIRAFEPDKLRELLKELGFGSFERKIFQDENGETKNSLGAKPRSAKASTEVAAFAASPGSSPDKKSRKATAAESDTPWTEETWTKEELRKRIPPYAELWAFLTERGLFFAHESKVIRVDASDAEIGETLGRKHLRWKGHDVKAVMKALKIPDQIVVWDEMLAAYVVRPKEIESFEHVYEQFCGKKLPDLCTPADQMLAHQELEVILREKMIAQEGLHVFETLDLPLVPVLTKMELNGILLDSEELKRQSKLLQEDIRRLEEGIFKEAGENFNIGSPKQLGRILFEKLQLPVGRKTKTGYSTDSDVLEGLSAHPIAKLILEYRELTKLKSTYVDALPALANPTTGRIHTSLNQAATSTGRLSSTNPNLQNIPIRTARGREVRKAFIASPGHCLISADYSQIELRVLAHITGDPGLTKAFLDDLDIHAATASEVFNIPLHEVTSEHRRIAKAVNFGLAYGQGAFGLADVLGISRGEATDIIQRYFTRFAGVKKFMEDTVREGIENGYVSTLFGRRRYIDELSSKNPMLRRAGERAAINAPIQGTASDLVKLAMIKAHQSLHIPLLLQVHDELLFECPMDEADQMVGEIKMIMESVYKLNVPLKVNIGKGVNWDDAH